MTQPLAGKCCLITGASRGLGRALASAFWSAGASVALVARAEGDLRAVVTAPPPAAGQSACIIASDLADLEAPQRIIDAARKHFQHLDILINNAAILGPIGPAWQNDWNQWQSALQINLLAPIALDRLAIPWMSESRDRKKIIHLSGGGGTSARPNFSSYATAKAGLIRFSETLADETRAMGIDVNCIAPGVMHTEMTQGILRSSPQLAGEKEFASAQNIAGAGDADFAPAIGLSLFLASSSSDGITGKLISAAWDDWASLAQRRAELASTDVYTLRRIVPADRGMDWGSKP